MITSDPSRRFVFAGDPRYKRTLSDWYWRNDGTPSQLFLDGALVSQESGSWSLSLEQMWRIQPDAQGIKVAVIDGEFLPHMKRCIYLIETVAPQVEILRFPVLRFYPADIAAAVSAALSAGCNIINLSAAVLNCGEPPNDGGLKALFQSAQMLGNGVIVSCAVPNANVIVSPNGIKDYPTTWAQTMWNILPASAAMMDGTKITAAPGSAVGNKVFFWPGRNIPFPPEPSLGTEWIYYSGSSYATAIQSGCLALMLAQVKNGMMGAPDAVTVAQAVRDFATYYGGPAPTANPLKAMLGFDGMGYTMRTPQTEA